jgi:hypothetical protein
LKKWKAPIIGIIGSHDYYGYELKSLKRTAVGALQKSDVVDLVGIEKDDYREFTIGGKDVIICGTSHTFYLDKDPFNYFKPLYKENAVQIQLTHGSLLDSPAIFEHTLIKDVKTSSHIVLGAHYHPGWKKNVYKINDTYFMHPGAIARLDNSGVQRIPKASIINIEKDITFDFFNLSSAILHPFKGKSLPNVQESISPSHILELIESIKVNIIDVKEQLSLLSTNLNYPQDVVEEAFRLLEDAENI